MTNITFDQIGYYHLAGLDPSLLDGTDFHGLAGVFENAWSKIKEAFELAYKYRIGILLGRMVSASKSLVTLTVSLVRSSRCPWKTKCRFSFRYLKVSTNIVFVKTQSPAHYAHSQHTPHLSQRIPLQYSLATSSQLDWNRAFKRTSPFIRQDSTNVVSEYHPPTPVYRFKGSDLLG